MARQYRALTNSDNHNREHKKLLDLIYLIFHSVVFESPFALQFEIWEHAFFIVSVKYVMKVGTAPWRI